MRCSYVGAGRSSKIDKHTDSRPPGGASGGPITMRVGAAVISVTVPLALGAKEPMAPMAFETQPFLSPNSATLANEVTVQAKLVVGTTFAWSMQDDHAMKHSVFF